ncbi:MAG: hypothetical protein WCW67_08360 [Candidatus Margulisiibacteriota bacterium]|jgi:flavorubredoxin
MDDPSQIVMSTLTLLGIGGIVGGYITYLLDKNKEREFKILEQKEKRYKSCLLFMDAFFEPKNIKYLSSRHPDIDNAQDILEFLKMEYHEMMLYASKEVVMLVKIFIENPTNENYLRTILGMRHDLFIKKNDLDLDGIRIELITRSEK